MNCKQGDLAIHVSGLNVGKIVTCVKYVGYGAIYTNLSGDVYVENKGHPKDGHVWEVDADLHAEHHILGPMTSRLQYDRALKPLDADLLDDEVVENKELETA